LKLKEHTGNRGLLLGLLSLGMKNRSCFKVWQLIPKGETLFANCFPAQDNASHHMKTKLLNYGMHSKAGLGSSDFSKIPYDLYDLIQPLQLLVMDHPFSEEEIKIALADVPLDHAPGPDGFNDMFLKKCWPTIQNDFDRLLQQFWNGYLDIEAINDSFITHIPNKRQSRNSKRLHDHFFT
jgi:hypothetical protein